MPPLNISAFETVSLRKEVLSRLGVFYKDFMSGDGFANSHWLRLGHDFDDMASERWLEKIHPDDRQHAARVLNRHLRGETPEFRCEFRVRDDGGTYRWFISSGVVERRDQNGEPITFVGHDEDVTDLHNLREELVIARQEAEDRAGEAEALRGAGAVVVATLDGPTAVRSLVQQLKALVPYRSAMVCELEDRKLRFVGGSVDVTAMNWRGFAAPRRRSFLSVIKSRIPSVVTEPGGLEPHKLYVPLVVRGATVGVLAISREEEPFATEDVRIAMSMADYLALALSNARIYSRMQQRAEIDQLSGVLTRRAFMETGEQIMDQAFRDGRPLCCLILDLDHFKSINDTYGHPVGDQVLRTLGSVLRDCLRSTDLVGRFGGEEFCALLPSTQMLRGKEVAERLRAAIEATEFTSVPRRVTASIGISTLVGQDGSAGPTTPADRLTIEQIIKRADVALYNAKSSGRNRVMSYDPDMAGG